MPNTEAPYPPPVAVSFTMLMSLNNPLSRMLVSEPDATYAPYSVLFVPEISTVRNLSIYVVQDIYQAAIRAVTAHLGRLRSSLRGSLPDCVVRNCAVGPASTLYELDVHGLEPHPEHWAYIGAARRAVRAWEGAFDPVRAPSSVRQY